MAEIQLASLAAEAREAIDSEDLARAADACRRAILRFPRWVEGYWLLGHILVESGYVPQARSCFEAVASAMPDDPRAYQGLADAADQQHDIATAVAGLTRALEVGEDSQSVLAEL
jgi:tetratricopeptide (TPR) repeat protein